MAFTGLSVTAGYAGAAQPYRSKTFQILSRMIWSESPASNTPTTNAAPNATDNEGQPLFHIRAAEDAWVAIGPNPDPSAGPRFLAAAGVDFDIYCQPGDRAAWVAA